MRTGAANEAETRKAATSASGTRPRNAILPAIDCGIPFFPRVRRDLLTPNRSETIQKFHDNVSRYVLLESLANSQVSTWTVLIE